MSAIFGIVNFNGEPAERRELEKMQNAMDYVQSTEKNILCEGSVGFGHMKINSSPEAEFENLPLQSDCGNYIYTAYARLDYRNELGKKLGLSNIDLERLPDSTLVLKAYLKWDEDCVHHLYGDWIFAVYNKKERKLFLAKDQTGNTGIYYSQYKDYFCFSTSVKGILAMDWINKELDDTAILIMIAFGLRYKHDQTLYKNIYNLKVAHYLSVTSDMKLYPVEYWTPYNIKPIVCKNEADYIENFLALYNDAINSSIRATGKVGIMLSSGLDSSSVAAVTAPLLKKQDKSLYAFTSVPFYTEHIPKRLMNRVNERDGVHRISNFIGNIETNFIDANDRAITDSLKNWLELTENMVVLNDNLYWLQSISEKASQYGVKRMLTGQNGNFTISWNGEYQILNSLLSGKFIDFCRDFKEWRTYNNINLSLAFKMKIGSPLKRKVIEKIYNKLPVEPNKIIHNSAINQKLSSDLNLYSVLMKLNKQVSSIDPNFIRPTFLSGQTSEAGLMFNELRMHFGLEYVDPTKDKRIIEFTFGLPNSMWVSKGIDRYLIRKSMEGKIPDDILYSTLRGVQAADIGIRLKDDLQLKLIFDTIKNKPFIKKYLNFDKVKEHLQELQAEKSFIKKNIDARQLIKESGIALFLDRYQEKYT